MNLEAALEALEDVQSDFPLFWVLLSISGVLNEASIVA